MNNDIIKVAEGFYYFDEYDSAVGPFNTLKLAEIAADAALRWQAKDHQEIHTIRKMKDNMGT